MKICSDSLIFGAMIPLTNVGRILDVGAGTGILSLMLAQKNESNAFITAVEITEEGAREAAQNFSNSLWSEQLNVIQSDIQSYAEQFSIEQDDRFDLIVCNPPFFSQHSKTNQDNELRHKARHTDSLSFNDLFSSVEQLLSLNGSAYFLIPKVSIKAFFEAAAASQMIVIEQTDIAESESHSAKVTVLRFIRETNLLDTQTLKVQHLNKFSSPNQHSERTKALLKPFLLRYA